MNSRHKNTSILLSEDVKPWLYRKLHIENRSLSNYLNTMLKQEKEREEIWSNLKNSNAQIEKEAT